MPCLACIRWYLKINTISQVIEVGPAAILSPIMPILP